MLTIRIYPKRNLATLFTDSNGTLAECGFVAFTEYQIWGVSENHVTFFLPSAHGNMISTTICADRILIVN